MDNADMLSSVILLLREIHVHGENDIAIMHDVFSRLHSLSNGIKEDKMHMEAQIKALETQLKTRPAIQLSDADGAKVIKLGGETVDLDTGAVIPAKE